MNDIVLNDRAYVFTSWGLVKGRIVKQRIDKYTGVPQYKVNIDIDRQNTNKEYNFWYVKEQLHRYYFIAIVTELFKPFGWAI
jgi:hypothetical protein